MQHFATHLRPGQQTTHSLRASQYKQPTKRKRDEDSEPLESLDDDAKGPPASPNAQSFAPSAPLETSQLRVAGLLPDDAFEAPPPPFPHAPAKTSKHVLTHAKTQQEIAGLNPPIFVPNATSSSDPVGGKSEKPALRKTHLEILSTVMHRCLFEGDYDRAARAWGMILRTQVAGQPIDPRNHGRWGIGAELLLRRNPARQANKEQYSPNDDDTFTEEGFELARDYYERLIVQYPYLKRNPRALDERTFYPPLFSVWIKQILERSRQARKQYQENQRHSRSASMSSEGDITAMSEDARAHEASIQADELAEAREICQRLDYITTKPPHDQQAELLSLRGHVGLWISDLLVGNARPARPDDSDSDMSEHNLDSFDEPPGDKLGKYTESLRELKRAQDFFIRAETNGEKGLSTTLASVESRMRELTKQVAQLEG